jgi:hypothetical protein
VAGAEGFPLQVIKTSQHRFGLRLFDHLLRRCAEEICESFLCRTASGEGLAYPLLRARCRAIAWFQRQQAIPVAQFEQGPSSNGKNEELHREKPTQ